MGHGEVATGFWEVVWVAGGGASSAWCGLEVVADGGPHAASPAPARRGAALVPRAAGKRAWVRACAPRRSVLAGVMMKVLQALTHAWR